MKNSLKDIIKGVVASSIAAIVGAHGAKAAPVYTFNDTPDDALKETDSPANKGLSQKFLLNITADDDYYVTSHRSHRSHRSHSSHRSGSSHYSSSHASHYSSTSTTKSSGSSSRSSGTSTKSSTSSSASSIYSSPSTKSSVSLGSRTVIKGMSGEDVKLLSDFFVTLNYMTVNNILKNKSGVTECNDAMIKAVNSYQTDKGFPVEDRIDKTTALALQKDAKNYRMLGSRVLTEGMSGTDVSELKNILIDKGVLRGKRKGKYEETTLDETIVEILEAYLIENGIGWTGKVDTKVVSFLKK